MFHGLTQASHDSFHKLNESAHQEEQVTRKNTLKDLPVKSGKRQGELQDDSLAGLPSKSVSINDDSFKENLTMTLPEEDEDVKRLSNNISLCLDSITFTKALIHDYITFFESQGRQLGDEGNEIFRKHFT